MDTFDCINGTLHFSKINIVYKAHNSTRISYYYSDMVK